MTLYEHCTAARPADAADRLAATTGESPARAADLIAGALPLLAAALPSAAGDGLDALLSGKDIAADDLLRRLFGADIDALARSLAGSTRSTRVAALAALELAVQALTTSAVALADDPADRAALVAHVAAGRGAGLAAMPPQLVVVVSNFPSLMRRITPPRQPRTKKDKPTENWMLNLMRRMRPK
jgi:hypothetical protein